MRFGMKNFTPNEVCQIYMHISSMCGNPNAAEGCRIILDFCKKEMAKIETEASQLKLFR